VTTPAEFKLEELVAENDELGEMDAVVLIAMVLPVPLSVKTTADITISRTTASAIEIFPVLEMAARLAIALGNFD